MWLCRQETGLTLREIGERFGAIHDTAVNPNVRCFTTMIDANQLNDCWPRVRKASNTE